MSAAVDDRSSAGLPEVRRIECAHGAVDWRESGRGQPLVLLHGIGSGAGAWQAQFRSLGARFRVLAWDAPGYGESDPLPMSSPSAADYAVALEQSLLGLGVERPVIVGHSLGALIASGFVERVAAGAPVGLTGVVLVSPALGYGASPAPRREQVRRERRERLDALGIEGMARSRAAGLLSPAASAQAVERVAAVMARATDRGYRQAIELLVNDDLAGRFTEAFRLSSDPTLRPLAVLCGDLDRVTTPEASRGLAERFGWPYRSLAGLAHACYVEGPDRFDAALLEILAAPAREAA